MNLLYIAVGGALGAVLRYLAGNAAVKYFNPQLPYGTFIINISGCFLMGLLMTLIVDKGLLPPVWRLFLCVGVLGGFTTFSSFGYEVYTLFAEGNLACALLYAALSCLLGVLAAAFGVFGSKNFNIAFACLKRAVLLSFFILCMKGCSLLLAALSRLGDSACFAWAFLVFTAYVR